MELLIFKTDIGSHQKMVHLKSYFLNEPKIISWSIDTEDVDKVLKIHTDSLLNQEEVISAINEYGIYCEELE